MNVIKQWKLQNYIMDYHFQLEGEIDSKIFISSLSEEEQEQLNIITHKDIQEYRAYLKNQLIELDKISLSLDGGV